MTSTTAPSSRQEYRLAFARLVLVRADERGDYLVDAYAWVTANHPTIAELAGFATMNALRVFISRHKVKDPEAEPTEFDALFRMTLRIGDGDLRNAAHITSRTEAERASRHLVRSENAECAARLYAAIKADTTDRTLRKVLEHYAALLAAG